MALNLKFLFHSRAQSSMTDALYFLLIVTALSGMMFVFSNNYGASIEKRMTSQYELEYANSALKTILYSNTPRQSLDPVTGLPVSLDDAQEVDYLLTRIKEDYANDRKLDEPTLRSLLDTVQTVMAPVNNAFDYVFYLYIPERYYRSLERINISGAPGTDDVVNQLPAPQVIILVLKKTQFPAGNLSPQFPRNEMEANTATRNYYFCNPTSFDTVSVQLLPALGHISVPVESRIYLSLFSYLTTLESGISQSSEKFVANANLIMWVPQRFPESFEQAQTSTSVVFPRMPSVLGELNCVPAEQVLVSNPGTP